MLDFNHILSTPGYNFQQFYGTSSVTLRQWQTWQKPRGVNWVYIIGVGGGGSGSVGGRAATTAGGGGGGGSGAQTSVLIPAAFIPDTLYIQPGAGGSATNLTVALAGANGLPTYVSIEPFTAFTANMTLLLASGGNGGGAEATGGAPGGAGGTLATIANMPLAGRGQYTFFVGQPGGAGGTRAGGAPYALLAVPTTGLMVTGGQGGGAGGTTPTAGAGFAAVTGALGQEFYTPLEAGAVASGATPATAGVAGIIVKNNLLNYGGTGGGGSSATLGGNAGAGGNGAPGCGGGGAGGSNTAAATVAPAGFGGAGFVYIISW